MNKKLENKIIAILKYNKKTECFYTTDGNVFFDENKAKYHAKQINCKVGKYILNSKKDKEDGKEDKPSV